MTGDTAIAAIIPNPTAEALSHIAAVIAIHITEPAMVAEDTLPSHSVMSKLTVTEAVIQVTTAAEAITEGGAATVAAGGIKEGEITTEGAAKSIATKATAVEGNTTTKAVGEEGNTITKAMEEAAKSITTKAAGEEAKGIIAKAAAIAAEDMATMDKEAAAKKADAVEDAVPTSSAHKHHPAITPFLII
jgi:hypothetical protein